MGIGMHVVSREIERVGDHAGGWWWISASKVACIITGDFVGIHRRIHTREVRSPSPGILVVSRRNPPT